MECEYIHSTTVPRYNFKALYLSISIFCDFTIPLHYILETNIILCTPLHLLLTLVTSSFADLEPSCNLNFIKIRSAIG